MGELGNIVLAFCGFSVVCCGSMLLALLLLGKVTGRTMLFPAMSMFSSMLFGEKEEQDEERESRPRRRQPRRRDFRHG